MSIDTEKQGHIPISHLSELLEKHGLAGLPKQLQDNFHGVVDHDGTDVIEFQSFLSTWSFLLAGKRLFNDVAQNGKVSNDKLESILLQLNYKLDPSTVKLMYCVVDKKFEGSFDLHGLYTGLLFLVYALYEFRDADEEKTGSLVFDRVKLLLPELGLDATEEEARKIFDEIDLDKSGTVEYEEFIGLVIKLRFPNEVAKLQ